MRAVKVFPREHSSKRIVKQNVGIPVPSECGRDRRCDQKPDQARRRDIDTYHDALSFDGHFTLERALWPSATDDTNGFSNEPNFIVTKLVRGMFELRVVEPIGTRGRTSSGGT